jgi:CelD/BcsL family acetyltransferase involved in cellulose biosynthesis
MDIMPDAITIPGIPTEAGHNEIRAPELIPGTTPVFLMEEYHSFDELQPLAREWDGFIEEAGGEIFLTFDWCRLWWHYYGTDRKLLVFIFRRSRQIVGILPVFLETVRVTVFPLRIVKLVGCDFGPFTFSICIHPESADLALSFFVKRLNEERWDLLMLGELAGRFERIETLRTQLRQQFGAGFAVIDRICNVQTYHAIPDSWEALLRQLPKGDRYKFKREYKRLRREEKCLHSPIAEADDFDQFFDEFVSLHQRYWNRKKRTGHFNAWPCSREFHRAVARSQLALGRLRLQRLMIGDDVIGYSYAFKFGSTYHQFLDGRRCEDDSRTSFFRLDFGETAKKAMLEKVTSFDSLRGSYDYKLHIGGYHKDIHKIFVHRSGAFHRFRIKGLVGLIRIYDALYRKLWRNGIMPLTGGRNTPLSRTWIRLHVLRSCYWG